MRKVDPVIENYICQKLFGLTGLYTLTDVQEKITNLKPEQVALKIAAACVGVHEEGADNCGALIESMQKTIGVPMKQAWCASFQQTIEALVEKWCGVTSSLPESESAVRLFNLADHFQKLIDPEHLQTNDLIVWQHLDNSLPTPLGHVGRIYVAGDSTVQTIEGNTGPGVGVQREGDGVYLKYRDLKGYKTMQLLGFIRITYTKKEVENVEASEENQTSSIA